MKLKEQPLPQELSAPPEGWVYVGTGTNTLYKQHYPYYAWVGKGWYPRYQGNCSRIHYAAPEDRVERLPQDTRPWITDRTPTKEDSNYEYVAIPSTNSPKGWVHAFYSTVMPGQPWAPVPTMPPYEPKHELKPETKTKTVPFDSPADFGDAPCVWLRASREKDPMLVIGVGTDTLATVNRSCSYNYLASTGQRWSTSPGTPWDDCREFTKQIIE